MTFLNPLAFILLFIILWIFKDSFFKKSNTSIKEFQKEHKIYAMQTKLIFISLIFSILALSRPAITNEITQEKFDANEYIIALDASYSMAVNDLTPSRYEVAKKEIISLFELDTADRFTIFAFTTNPLLICPPTTDHSIAISALNSLSQEYILTKGTSLESLLNRVATLAQEHKSLILFSDGGEEHNLAQLLSIAKKSAITINIVAFGSSKGSLIYKDGDALKDVNSHLVISRINPILKNLAQQSGGFYKEINTNQKSISQEIYQKLQAQNQKSKELSSDVISYKELCYFPLIMAFVTLFIALTKALNFLPLVSLIFLFFPHFSAKASLFDFHYKQEAKEAYEKKEYPKAIDAFKRLTPSQYSYMSIANSYYSDKQYKNSLRYYSKIKSKTPHIKSIVFYNMGNAAFKLKKYQRAENFYKQSLALEFSKEAKENLFLIYKHQLLSKINVADMLPTADSKQVKNITKKNDTKQDNKEKKESASSSSKRQTNQGSQGAGGSKSKKKKATQIVKSSSKNRYKMGYNAYELINKGYIHEQKPW